MRTCATFHDAYGDVFVCLNSAYPSTVNTTETILLSAHYDSRGSFGSTRAPGGDDDGSGTVALLSIARTVARLGIKFKKNVELCAFAGEEQGLLGSRAYARPVRVTRFSLHFPSNDRYAHDVHRSMLAACSRVPFRVGLRRLVSSMRRKMRVPSRDDPR